MAVNRTFTHTRWEKEIGFCRAIRAGDHIYVTGTAPIDDDGNNFAPGDAYAQARRCLQIIEKALADLDATMADVVRTRMFVTDISLWQEFGRAHGEFFADHPPATTMAEGYGLRWLVEEFHKSEKTGCRVEERQLRDTDRLEPLIGLLSVLAVYLLQLKYVARENPDRPARDLFGDEVVAVMAAYLQHSRPDLSVTEFWRGIGRLGGHPGRKCDGPLGWLRAWRGWQAFQWIVLGASLPPPKAAERCG